MVETVSVLLSGPAFSFLLYENSKAQYGQEGFLLGELIQKETSTITDNDQRQQNVSRVIKINSVLPCPTNAYFYDGVGKIDETKVNNFLGKQASKVIAWYKFKHQSSFKLTFREKIIHHQLSEMFNVPSDLFTLCLLITEASDNGATHSYQQNFLRFNHCSNKFDSLPLHIVNLSDPNNTYKSVEPCSQTFRNIIKKLEMDPKKTQGLTFITKVQSAIQDHVDSVVKDLAESEAKLFRLEAEIKDLIAKKRTKQEMEVEENENKVENGSNDEISQSESNSLESSPEPPRKNIKSGSTRAILSRKAKKAR